MLVSGRAITFIFKFIFELWISPTFLALKSIKLTPTKLQAASREKDYLPIPIFPGAISFKIPLDYQFFLWIRLVASWIICEIGWICFMDHSDNSPVTVKLITEVKSKFWGWSHLQNIYPFDMGVSKNHGTSKSSILIGFSTINHPFWGTPIFGNIHIVTCNMYLFWPGPDTLDSLSYSLL